MGNVFKKLYLVAKIFLEASKYFKFNETGFEFVFCVYVFMAAGLDRQFRRKISNDYNEADEEPSKEGAFTPPFQIAKYVDNV